MDFLFFVQLVKAVVKELWQHKYTAFAVALVISFSIMGFGALRSEKFEVSTTLYADQQNIIQPLLAGQAQVTRVEDRRQVVRDLMLSRKVLEQIVQEEGFLVGGESAAEEASIVSALRDSVEVKTLGPDYIGVSYKDTNPDRAYTVVTRLVDYFIKESSANKRSESKQAFMFIDRQANSYKEQLREAEDRLKKFRAENVDVTEGQVANKIDNLRTSIANLELDLEQAQTRETSLNAQVKQEDRYLTQKAKRDEYKERIAEAVSQLDNLRLSLTDNHPDVINLKEHIEGLRTAAEGDSNDAVSGGVTGIENPVYDQLRGELAAAKVEKIAVEKRLATMRNRLDEEFSRAKRVAAKNAELSELTRDYDVTKQLYEELLERKEKARLSMTLDLEGQGVS